MGCNGGNGLHGAGPKDGWMDVEQQAQDCSSDQTRSDQTRSPQATSLDHSRDRREGVAQSLPRNLPYVSESVLGSKLEARQSSRGDWGRGGEGQERSRQDKAEQTRGQGGRGKKQNPPSWMIPHR